MSKIAYYLQEHLDGEVTDSADARRYFSADASILQVTPDVIVYPRNESDVRKTARFSWQLAERGRKIPITARGNGTDQSGAAIGEGIILAFPAHMNRVLEYDGKDGVSVVEPGTNFGTLQQTLITHGRFLPSYPASLRYSSIGGAAANNAAGEKSIKYGAMGEYVRGLRVVLANGEVIETGPLGKRELDKKLGLTTFEGEVYRAVDALVEEYQETIAKSVLTLTKNSTGYNLVDVKQKGEFDLTPLFIGSQGTLGIITELILDSEPHSVAKTLYQVKFDSIKKATKAVIELRKFSNLPSSIEMVNSELLDLVDKLNPNQLGSDQKRPFPKVTLFVEFDDGSDGAQKRLGKKAEKIFIANDGEFVMTNDREEQEKWWQIRSVSAVVASHSPGQLKALPIINDGVVPVDRLDKFIKELEELLSENNLGTAMWGHMGDGNIHVLPFLNLSEVGDRQKLFRVMDKYYELVIKYKGSTSGELNDGRLRGPYLSKVYGDDIYEVFAKLKRIFDPHNILNPGVKIDVSIDDIKRLMRSEYSLKHLYDFMPHS